MDALTAVKTDEQTEYRGIVSDVRAADLPNEVSNSFSNAPYEFEQTSSVLWDDTQQIYYHACIANRFSEHYLVLCGQLEKNIKQLGSFCVTKAALEQKGMLFPKLEKMNVRELVCMVSYHFRKAHASLQGIYRDNDLLGITYLNWEFRWVGLGNRLKSTEVKIQMIKEGRYMPKAVLEQNEAFKGEPRTSGEDALSTPQALRANASALPVKGAMARTMLAAEREAEKQAEFVRRTRERLLRQAERLDHQADRMAGTIKPSYIKMSKKDEIGLNLYNAEKIREEAAKLDPETPEPKRGRSPSRKPAGS